MTVTVNPKNLKLIMTALRTQEAEMRRAADEQMTTEAAAECMREAVALYDLHDNLGYQLHEHNMREHSRHEASPKLNPFDPYRPTMKVWDPNDPRNW